MERRIIKFVVICLFFGFYGKDPGKWQKKRPFPDASTITS